MGEMESRGGKDKDKGRNVCEFVSLSLSLSFSLCFWEGWFGKKGEALKGAVEVVVGGNRLGWQHILLCVLLNYSGIGKGENGVFLSCESSQIHLFHTHTQKKRKKGYGDGLINYGHMFIILLA